MSNQPTIKIRVDIAQLGQARGQLVGLFAFIRKELGRVVSGAKVLNKELAGVESSGFAKLVKSAKEAAKSIGRIVGGLKVLQMELDSIKNGSRVVRSTFDLGRQEIARSIAGLKRYQDELDEIHKKLRRNNRANPQSQPKNKKNPGEIALGNISKVRSLGSAFRDAGRQALFFSAAMTGVFVLLAKEAAEFEQAVVNVIAVISGLTEKTQAARDAQESLRKTILELGKNTEFTGTEVANAARQLALAGFSAEEIEVSLRSILGLASSTNTELEKAALISVRIKNAFGLSAESINDVNDILSALVTNSASTLEGVGESFKLAAPIAAAYGQEIEEIATIFGVLADSGIQNCYDDQTEVLTEEGWIPWTKADDSYKYATVNKENHAIEWHRPIRMYEYEYEGDMYHTKNRSIDLMVTPNHNMYAKKANSSNYELIEAKDLKGKIYQTLTAPENKTEDVETFTLNGFQQNRGNWIKNVEALKISMDDWLVLLGSYLSEGWCSRHKNHDYRVQVCQKNTSKGFETYSKTFERLPWKTRYSEKEGKFTFFNEQVYKHLKKFGSNAAMKFVPTYVFKVSKRQIRLFIDSYRLGDGSGVQKSGYFQIFTTSKKMADDLQKLGVLAGYRTSMNHRDPDKDNLPEIKGRVINSTKRLYIVSFSEKTLEPWTNPNEIKRNQKRRGIKGKTRHELFEGYVQYKGKVYCAEVPHNTLIVRRNGKVAISGNSRGGTGLNRFISEITEKREKLEPLLESVGSSFDKIDPSLNHITETFDELIRLTNSGAIDGSTIFDIFDQRSARIAVSVINTGSEAVDELNGKIRESAGLSESIREFRIDTVQGQFTLFTSAVSAAAVAISESFGPTLKSLINVLTSLTKKVIDFAESGIGRTLIPIMFKLTVVVVGLTAVFGTLLVLLGVIATFGGVVIFFANLTAIMSYLGAAATFTGISLGALVAPLLLVSAAIGGVVAAGYFLLTWLTGASADFDAAKDSSEAFKMELEALDAVVKNSAQTLRELNKQTDLIAKLPTLKPVEISALFDNSVGDDPFDSGAISAAIAEVNVQLNTARARLEELEGQRGWFWTDGEVLAGINAQKEGIRQLESNLEKLNTQYGRFEATINRLKNADTLEDTIKKRQELLKRSKKAIEDLTKRRETTSEFSIDRKAIDLVINRRREELQETKKLLEDDLNLLNETSRAQRKVLADTISSAQTPFEKKEALFQFQKIIEERKQANASFGKTEKDFNKLLMDLRNERKSDLEKELEENRQLFAERNAVLATFLGSDGKLGAAQAKIETLSLSVEQFETRLSLLDPTKDIEEINKLKKLILDTNNNIAKVEGQIVEARKTAAELSVEEKRIAAEILNLKKESLDLDNLKAELNLTDDLSEQLRLMQLIGEAENKRKLKKFDDENKGIANFTQEREKFEKNLNAQLEKQIENKLKMLDLEKNLADLSQKLDKEDGTKLDRDLIKIEEEKDKRLDLLQIERERVQAALDNNKIFDFTAKKEFDRIDALEQRVKKNRDRQVREAKEAEKQKTDEFIINQKIKAAKLKDDVTEEFKLKEQLRKRQAELEIEEKLASLSDAERKKALAREIAAIDTELAEEKKKREEEVRKKNEKQVSAAAKARKAASKVNGFLKTRADIESKITDNLVKQVQSLREAGRLIAFLNRLQSGAEKRAENRAKAVLAKQRRLNNLQDQRKDALAAGDSEAVARIDNKIARATLELGIARDKAANAADRASLSVEGLTQALEILKQKADAVTQIPSLPSSGMKIPPSAIVPLQGQPLPGGMPGTPIVSNKSEKTFNVNVNVEGAGGDPETIAGVVVEEFQKIYDRLV